MPGLCAGNLGETVPLKISRRKLREFWDKDDTKNYGWCSPATEKVSPEVLDSGDMHEGLGACTEADCFAEYLAGGGLQEVAIDSLGVESEDEVMVVCKKIKSVMECQKPVHVLDSARDCGGFFFQSRPA